MKVISSSIERIILKDFSLILLLGLTLLGCEKVSNNAVDIDVDFTWEGMQSCDWGNPEIRISRIPQNTKTIKLRMYDHVYRYDHGSVEFLYRGENVIEKHRFKIIQGPCAYSKPGNYEVTIKALDKNGTVIGLGSKSRYYPEP